jgi:Transposase
MNLAGTWSANSCIPTTLCCSVEWSSLMTGAIMQRSRRPGASNSASCPPTDTLIAAPARTELTAVIKTISHGVPAGLPEPSRRGRTLKQRAADVLAYFDRPGTSNGPTDAINGRLEHLRGTAVGFRNLTNYITRSLLDTGGFGPRLHPLVR